MNPRMWEHPATQANAETLRERGVELVGPEEGELAEGEVGVGRMSEPEAIFARGRGAARASETQLRGRRVARHRRRDARAARRGALPRQPLLRPHGRRARRRGAAARRRRDAARREPRRARARRSGRGRDTDRRPISSARRSRAADADVVVMAAAVADYRPVRADRRGSARRTAAPGRSTLEPTDRRAARARRARARTARCWSASPPSAARRGLERAREKLADKHVDLIVFNDVSRDDIGFDAADNEVVAGRRRAASGGSRRRRRSGSPRLSSTRSATASGGGGWTSGR